MNNEYIAENLKEILEDRCVPACERVEAARVLLLLKGWYPPLDHEDEAEREAERDALAAHVEQCYRAGYQDGYAERENGHEYEPQEAWEHSEERKTLPTTSLVRLKAERDALAAHVERLHERINALRVGRRPIANLDSQLATLIHTKPATSLDRLKAEWKAEALEEFSSEFRSRMKDPNLICVIDAVYIEKMAAEYRRQASGGE